MRSQKNRSRIRLGLEHLEDRTVPTTVTLTGTTLTLLGTPGAEQIDVTQSGNTISALGQSFSTSQVQRLVIDAGDGNDTITVGSTVTALTYVWAGGGHDRVTGGGGTTQIYGGSGNDTITTGPGVTSVYGGTGTNSITGKAGDSITQGPANQNFAASTIEQQIIDLVNQQRAANGLSPLQASGQLNAAAELHSKDMASVGTMAHLLVGGVAPTLGARVDYAGYDWRALGENIAYGYADAQSVMNAWMNSSGHRANILSTSYTQIGVGIEVASNGTLYFTQVFGAPMSTSIVTPPPAPTPPPPAPTPPPTTPPPTSSITVTQGFASGAGAKGQIYATGANTGSAPVVTVYDMASGKIRWQFQAYASTFRGGVRVAVADVTGDGQQDVITAPGAGAAPLVVIYDGVTGRAVRSFYAYSTTWTRGVFVAAGDVNGDGRADIVTGSDAGGPGNVRAFDGRTLTMFRNFNAYAGTLAGARVAVGDVNGDGKADIVTAPGAGIAPTVRAFSGATGAQLYSFNAYDARWLGGVFVAVGDINGDGKADIVTGADAGGGAHVRAFSGADPAQVLTNLYTDSSFTGGIRVAVRDVNGDGKAEIITAQGRGGRQVRLHSPNGTSVLASFLGGDAVSNNGVFAA